MHAVVMVVLTTLCLSGSAESCIVGVDEDCEDDLSPTWEDRVESCLRRGRQVHFLSDRSQVPEHKLVNKTLDMRYLPSELQESPQRVGDVDLCPDKPQLPTVLQVYCDNLLQYETVRGSSQACAVKIRKENRSNRKCFHQLETRPTWTCQSDKTYSCVPCTSPNATNHEIIPSIQVKSLGPVEGPPSQQHPQGTRHESRGNTIINKMLDLEVTNGSLLVNSSVFCYLLDPLKKGDRSLSVPARLYHLKSNWRLRRVANLSILWCEGVDFWSGRVVRSRICLQYDYTCRMWLDDDRKVQSALETLTNKSRGMTTVTEAQNALDVILRSARSLPTRSVGKALGGFERFVSTVSLGGRQELMMEDSSLFSTLVVASAAGVASEGSAMKSLRRGSDAVAIAGDADLSVAVVLPPGAGQRRVALTKFTGRANNAFQQRGLTANSDVVSVTVDGGGVEYVDVVLRRRRQDKFGKCAIWNLDTNRWDTSYCEMLVVGEVGDVCRCWHLTHFGEILDDEAEESRLLDALSLLGCSLSLLGVSGVFVTAAICDEWHRRPSTRVLLQLVGAVALRDAVFVAVAVHDLPDTGCRVAGVALHYAVLAAAFWSVAAAVLQTLRLGTVAGVASVPHVVLVCALCAWLLPLLPLGLILALQGPAAYAKRGDATGFCFPRGLWFYGTVAFPTGLAVLVNSCVFCYLTYVIFQCSREGRRIRRSSNGSTLLRRKLLTCSLLFFLFGLTWVFGFPARSFALACIFCAVATPQGFVLFLFFVFGDAHARRKWSTVLTTTDSSSSTVKKSLTSRTFKKRSSSGKYDVTPLPQEDGAAAALMSEVATPEGNVVERTYRFSGSPPGGAEQVVVDDSDLPGTTEPDGASGMYNFPPIQKHNRSKVILKSYVTLEEGNEGTGNDRVNDAACNGISESQHSDEETETRPASEDRRKNV